MCRPESQPGAMPVSTAVHHHSAGTWMLRPPGHHADVGSKAGGAVGTVVGGPSGDRARAPALRVPLVPRGHPGSLGGASLACGLHLTRCVRLALLLAGSHLCHSCVLECGDGLSELCLALWLEHPQVRDAAEGGLL